MATDNLNKSGINFVVFKGFYSLFVMHCFAP